MPHEVWEEYYDRLAALIREHRTTLVFANTRRLVERVTRHLTERLGEEAVTAHHGSLSKERRADAEHRLKTGRLQALVATSSLELGIDIGFVDLVCQLGSPRWIATFLQRVGRSGHTVSATPKGRLFATSRDDLVECAALLREVRRGELDRLVMIEQPLDVLAQQIVAESAAEAWSEDALFELVRRAYPYRRLSRDDFDAVVRMVATGFTTRRGRRGALVHHDGVNGRIRGRRGARLTAITSGGAIPESADYRVVLEPEGLFVGSVHEDFAVESVEGDIFQLGNSSWRILAVQRGVVRVADAEGQPPTIPFWFGEAPARSHELSRAVSDLRRGLDARLDDEEAAIRWLMEETGVARAAAFQIAFYLGQARRLLGALPTQRTLILERFFDESGGMQLLLHAPFGSRLNRAWGLALRKRFCRQFNFELQAAATDDGLLLSLGPQHSFPLADVFRYLHPGTVRDVLVQALLDAPVFQARWRWNATISLAVLRARGGRRVPPQIQRMEADDLLAAAFPDAAACLENIAGDREIPDHPLVRQTIRDCLDEAMDLDALTRVLEAIHGGEVQCLARDLPEPSVLAAGLLNARPYAFLDDAPLEERRTQAVYARRAFEPSSAQDLGALDPEAIARVRDEAWPDVRDADELHDALLTCGFLSEDEIRRGRGDSWLALAAELASSGRAACETLAGTPRWCAAERFVEWRSLRHGDPVARETAVRELLRGRLSALGPVTARSLAASLGVTDADIEAALLALEGEGVILRGTFTPGTREREWCDRRLLARIHRYTLSRLRAEIEPVSQADYMRFLFAWQHVAEDSRVSGLEGLHAVVAQLEGCEIPAGAWESEVLPLRVDDYDPAMLDTLCLTGRVAWGRLSPPARPDAAASGPIRTTPIAMFLREHAGAWLRPVGSGSSRTGEGPPDGGPHENDISSPSGLSSDARDVLAALRRRGASFFAELVGAAQLLPTQIERALGELVGAGLVTSDSFTGLRALATPSDRRKPLGAAGAGTRRTKGPDGVETAGRWSLLRPWENRAEALVHRDQGHSSVAQGFSPVSDDTAIETQARALLRRYGVVCRRAIAREGAMAPWRDLVRVYRRLEARGEIRGGRFVAGLPGEQFALPEAVGQLRAVRRLGPSGLLAGISAVDPLNLAGIVTSGDAVPAVAANRLVYRDGVPLAARDGGRVRPLAGYEPDLARAVEQALIRRRWPEALRTRLHAMGARQK
jgi:ATP-dependent Lhr-like helicase